MASLRYKVLLLTIIPLLITLIIIGSLAIKNKADSEKELLLHNLDGYVVLLESGDLSFETAADKTKLEAIIGEKIEFSEIINKNYGVIYSSENSVIPFISEEDKADVDEAFEGVKTVKNIEARGRTNAAFVVISPLIVNKKVVSVLHLGLSNKNYNLRTKEYAMYLLLFMFGGLSICGIFIVLLLNRAVLKNVGRLKDSALEIQSGNLEKRIDLRTDDELGTLAKAFDSMRESIKSQKLQLEEYSKDLEKKVQERTKELETKNKELEKNKNELEIFNKFATDRELKMVELKKENEKLKQKTENREKQK